MAADRTGPSLIRAAHLTACLEALRGLGISPDARLARSRLPGWVETEPDARISLPMALAFVAGFRDEFPLATLAIHVSGRTGLASLAEPCRLGLIAEPTGLTRVRALFRHARGENTDLVTGIREEGPNLRLFCELPGHRDAPYLCIGEWFNLRAVIEVVRSIAGPGWCPIEMTFASTDRPDDSGRDCFAATRILVGQPRASILVERRVLARAVLAAPPPAETVPAMPLPDQQPLLPALRDAIRPYLRDGYPDLALAAEISGTSPRTLQRRLALHGYSYTRLVQETRHEIAQQLMHDPAAKIIDVALSCGYETPQHFSRSFRRFTGMTPSAYRRSLTGED